MEDLLPDLEKKDVDDNLAAKINLAFGKVYRYAAKLRMIEVSLSTCPSKLNRGFS